MRDLVLRLERLCRQQAFEAAANLPEGRLLFINIEPEAVADPELRDIMFTTLLAGTGVDSGARRASRSPSAPRSPTSRRSVPRSSTSARLGFRVAVDDARRGLRFAADASPRSGPSG